MELSGMNIKISVVNILKEKMENFCRELEHVNINKLRGNLTMKNIIIASKN